jgi:hypothetical protein
MDSDCVFISHSSADRPFVENVLLPVFQRAGVRVWYSPGDIRGSADWERSILAGLVESAWFLLVMTPQAQNSEWVRDEVMWAVEHRQGRIIPVLAETCDPRAIHLRLARIQHIDARTSPSSVLEALLEVLGQKEDGQQEDSGSPAAGHRPLERSLKTCRLVPYYLGDHGCTAEAEFIGFPVIEREGLRILLMEDGFAVALVEEAVQYHDVIDLLVQRRTRHLEILGPESPVRDVLHSLRNQQVSPGLIGSSRAELPYVMSMHWIDREQAPVSDIELRCFADPSILGISDDPLDEVSTRRVEKARAALANCTRASGSMDEICHGDDCYLVSWANVILATRGGGETEYRQLVEMEVRLQYLWHRIHLYSASIESLPDRIGSFELSQVKMEMLKTKLQYGAFCRTDPTGATHLNELRASLIRTSKLRELYEEFSSRTVLVDEMEAIL